MANEYVLNCLSAENSTTITVTHSTAILWNWQCDDGEVVWGTPYKGSVGSNLVNGGQGTLPLGDAAFLEGFKDVKVGSSGKGDRIGNIGGSFPLGQFDWECVKVT